MSTEGMIKTVLLTGLTAALSKDGVKLDRRKNKYLKAWIADTAEGIVNAHSLNGFEAMVDRMNIKALGVKDLNVVGAYVGVQFTRELIKEYKAKS